MAYSQTDLFVENNHGDMNLLNKELIIGDVYFVDANSANAGNTVYHGKSRDKPFSTIAYAVTQTTTNQGDWIIVSPNHTETIALQNGIEIAATMHNVTIAGATGRTQDYPVITFEAGDAVAAADLEVDGAGTVFKRLTFSNSEDGITACIDVNAEGCEFHDCIFVDADTANSVIFVAVAAAAHNFKMINCRNYGTATAGNDAFITFEGACAHPEITNLNSEGDFVNGNIVFLAAVTDYLFRDCKLENANASDVNFEGFAACTGMFCDSYMRIATDGQGTWTNTEGNSSMFQCFGNNAPDEVAMITDTLCTT